MYGSGNMGIIKRLSREIDEYWEEKHVKDSPPKKKNLKKQKFKKDEAKYKENLPKIKGKK